MRCSVCNKKLGILGFECVCKKVFCEQHRYSFVHNCPVDKRKQCMEKIERDNIQIRAQKVEKI